MAFRTVYDPTPGAVSGDSFDLANSPTFQKFTEWECIMVDRPPDNTTDVLSYPDSLIGAGTGEYEYKIDALLGNASTNASNVFLVPIYNSGSATWASGHGYQVYAWSTSTMTGAGTSNSTYWNLNPSGTFAQTPYHFEIRIRNTHIDPLVNQVLMGHYTYSILSANPTIRTGSGFMFWNTSGKPAPVTDLTGFSFQNSPGNFGDTYFPGNRDPEIRVYRRRLREET